MSNWRVEVIKNKLCSFCGSCLIVNDASFCPQINIPDHLYEVIPSKIDLLKTKSKISDLLNYCQDGCTVTTILKYILENHVVNSIVAVGGHVLNPKPIIVTNVNDVVKLCRSKYVYVPILQLLRNLSNVDVCIVGLPCHLRHVDKLCKILNIKLRLKISLVCYECFNYDLVKYLINTFNLSIYEVKKIKFLGSRMVVKCVNKMVNVELKNVRDYVNLCCKQCPEYWSINADIVVGSLRNNFNFVITQSKFGSKLIHEVLSSNYLDYVELNCEFWTKLINKFRSKQLRGRKFRSKVLELIRNTIYKV